MHLTTGESKFSGDVELDKLIDLWLKWDINITTRSEIQELVYQKDWVTLRKRLLQRLSFGTAGLRGRMRAGFDSINDLVVVQTAQGLCEYVIQQFPDKKDFIERGIVIGYDGRYNSKHFADLSACVFVSRGIKVWLYGKLVPTPFVPFAILQMKCLAGVMVTASHNPKEDNGYKIYWANGAQIISPHDKGIQNSILDNLTPLKTSWDIEALTSSDLIVDPFDKMFAAYNELLLRNLPKQFLQTNASSDLSFLYTAMHGVGYPFIKRAFHVANLKSLLTVAEQQDPDPKFPTVKFPNPEEGESALELSIKKADAEGITIIIANDPDADRLACAEKNLKTGRWKVFNGNELGALLGWWCMKNYRILHPGVDLSKCYMLASTVSSKILRPMAQKEGFNFEETLTGFKWMGNRAFEILESGEKVLFAFEEAIGFMCSDTVLDKDGISAACHLATMCCHLKVTEGITLSEQLCRLYEEYGYHVTQSSYLFCYEETIVKRIFERLRNFQNGERNTYPTSILNGEFPINNIRDLTTGVDTSKSDCKATLPTCSSTQMITFTFQNGLVMTLRTSGTEPKIKYYAEMCAKPEEKDWQELRVKLSSMVQAVIEEFLQPEKNNLALKCD